MKKSFRVGIVSFIFLCLYFVVGIFLLLGCSQESFSQNERSLYGVLLIAYYVVVGLFVFAVLKFHVYLFEPFTIISALYIGIFIYRPIQDLSNHAVKYAGVDLTSAGFKATIVFMMGYISFFLGYFGKKNNVTLFERKNENRNGFSVATLVMMWFVFYILCIISTLSSGFSLSYIFSLGSEGERIIQDGNTALLFLSNFATSLLVVWLMILCKSSNAALKVLLTVLTVVYLIMRNARWLILIMVLEPIVYAYSKKRKTPNILMVSVLGLSALTVFAWMQMNRYNIATGQEMQLFGANGGLSLELLLSPFDSDLTTYTTFYGMTQSYPNTHPYMLGKTFLYVFVLFIPRAIWKAKPDNPVRDMVENSLGSLARSNGRAVANIGEMYANFGIVGVLILMFFFGYITSKLKKLYEKPTENGLIIYSFLFPLMFQWVARGNFSGNFYYTLFAFVPFVIQWAISCFKRKS